MTSSHYSNSAFQKDQEHHIVKAINAYFKLAVKAKFGKAFEGGYSFHFNFANTSEKHHAKTNI